MSNEKQLEDTKEARVERTANTLDAIFRGEDVTPPTKAEEAEMTDHVAELIKKEALIYKKDLATSPWVGIAKTKVDPLCFQPIGEKVTDPDDDFNEPLPERTCNLDDESCESCS